MVYAYLLYYPFSSILLPPTPLPSPSTLKCVLTLTRHFVRWPQVQEDRVRDNVVVQSVQEKIRILGLSVEAGGSVRPGDALIGIESDDCSHWLLSRVKARLNNFRVPVGTKVRSAVVII